MRLRGPFVSLAHFVNRALVGVVENPELGRSGALQAALDNSGANISPDGEMNAFSGLDPATGRVAAKAWCEAVVQRMPDYVDAAQAADTRGPGLSGLNRTFGRRFQVVSFRWLRPDEI